MGGIATFFLALAFGVVVVVCCCRCCYRGRGGVKTITTRQGWIVWEGKANDTIIVVLLSYPRAFLLLWVKPARCILRVAVSGFVFFPPECVSIRYDRRKEGRNESERHECRVNLVAGEEEEV